MTRSSIVFPPGVSAGDSNQQRIALSPDGTHLAYAGGDQIYLRAMDRIEATPIRGTEGATEPFFSPDGQWLGFWADRQLKKVALTGGAPITLSELAVAPFGVSWASDDTIWFSLGGVLRVPGSGGTPEVIIPAEVTGRPQLLPGGEWVLFSPGRRQVVVQSLVTGERKVLIENGGDVMYLPTGHLAYVRDGTLLAVAFDVEQQAIMGGPVPLVEGVAQGSNGVAQVAHAADGTLIYQLGGTQMGDLRTLVWVDRDGNEEPLMAEPHPYASVRLAPDGRRVAIQISEANIDIWIYDLERDTPTRVTFDPLPDLMPIWTPDGERLVWATPRGGFPNMHSKAADGTGQIERVTTSENPQAGFSWSADGQTLVFNEIHQETGIDIGALSMDGEGRIEWLLEGVFNEAFPEVSPDGRWMAYESDESGQQEIYVTPFPNVDAGRWQISRDGGQFPLWAPDGRELFYQRLTDRAMMVAPIDTDPTFSPGNPSVLFDAQAFLVGAPPCRHSRVRYQPGRPALPHDQRGRGRVVRSIAAHPGPELGRGTHVSRAHPMTRARLNYQATER